MKMKKTAKSKVPEKKAPDRSRAPRVKHADNMIDLFREMNAILIQSLVLISRGNHTVEECEILAKNAIAQAREARVRFDRKNGAGAK